MKAQSKRIIIEGEVRSENQKLLNKYEQYINIKNLSPRTISNYLLDLNQWMKYMNTKQDNLLVSDVTGDDIEEYIYFRMKEGNNEDRIKRVCCSISAFYKFLRKKKMIAENPLEFLDRPKKCEGVRKKHFLTKEQVQQIKEGIKDMDIRIQTYIILSLETGGRISAIQSLTWDMIDNDEDKFEEVIEKGRKAVDLDFYDDTKIMLKKLKEHYEKEGIDLPYIFVTKYHGEYRCVGQTTLRRWADQAGKVLGIENFAPHSFRRTCATILKDNGVSLEEVSEKLNHSGSDVTKLYVKTNKTKLKAKMKAAWAQ